MFVFLSGIQSFGQTQNGFQISWDGSVACQSLLVDPANRKNVSIEDIPETICVKVCENTQINYMLSNNAQSFTATWEVAGGTIVNSGINNASIQWGNSGSGLLSFTILSQGNTIKKTICFDIIKTPLANFGVFPNLDDELIFCSLQEIFFKNLSTANNGSNIMHYKWDFGDGTTSAAFEPSHIYQTDGSFNMSLTVTNECGCTNVITNTIKIRTKGLELACPSVVCENQSTIYSIKFRDEEICLLQNDWSVAGGTIIYSEKGTATVIWDNVDGDGFGYLTYTPAECGRGCYEKTTVKIPVIKSNGTVKGKFVICAENQEKYSLPKWPSTIFEWRIDNNDNDNLAVMYTPDQANEVVIKALTAGTLILRCAYYNTLLKCGGTATFTIQVLPIYKIVGAESFCQNSLQIYNTLLPSVQNWTLKTASGAILSTTNDSTSFSYNFPTGGTYILSATYPGQCTPNDKTITVHKTEPAPALSSISNTTLKTCPNVPYNFTIAGVNPDGQYKWTVSNGGTFIGNDVGNTVAIKFGTAASHTITIVNQSLTTPVCTSAPISFTLNTLQVNAQITDNLPQITCGNTPQNYVANQLNTNNLYTEGETYRWSISPSNVGSVTLGQDTNSISVLWNNVFVTTIATLTLEIKKCNITKYITKTVTVIPVAQIAITAPNSVCSGSPITFTINTTNNVPYPNSSLVYWSFSDGTTATASGNTITKTFSNISIGSIGITAAAYIVNPNGCIGNTNNAGTSILVLPAPAAAVGLSSGSLAYCNTPINTVLAATTSPTGATLEWFKAGSNTVLGTGPTLLITGAANFGYGYYYFIATNSNGCSNMSNSIRILIDCPTIFPPNCNLVPLPVLTNTSALSCIAPTTVTNCDCGQINLVGNAPNSINQYWNIQGPNFSLPNYTGNSIGSAAAPLLPGDYYIMNTADYICGAGTTRVGLSKKVTVPYRADFLFAVNCGSDNASVNIFFYDRSPYFNPVTNRTFSYFKATSINGPWTFVSNSQNPTLANQTSGNYFFKLVITGTLNGVPQTPCEKIIQFFIPPFPVQSINIVNAPVACNDTAVQFEVAGGDPQTESYFWTFDNGAANTLPNPSRVFDNSGTQTVTVLITNRFGCTKTLTKTFVVPQKCFGGDIAPLDPVSCLGGKKIRLRYVPRTQECPAQYEWLKDGTLMASTTTPTFDISDAGTYRVRLRSTNNCTYTSPSTAIPTFVVPPALSLKVPVQACQYEVVNLEAFTTATDIKWYFNGVLENTFDNLKNVAVDFAVGLNTIKVIATNTFGCSTEVTKTLLIIGVPPKPIITIAGYNCNPYSVMLQVSGTRPFLWSNGMSTAMIEVTEGGVYKVTSGAGNCPSSAIINVPKNPDNFMWTFPYGCYISCTNNNMNVVGPIAPVATWDWNLNSNPILSGTGVVQPLLLNGSGVYSMKINTAFCDLESKKLYYNDQMCNKCDVRYSVISQVTNNQGFCEKTLTIQAFNVSNTPIAVTFSSLNSQVFVNPFSYVLNPGSNIITLQLIPINNFLGGAIKLIMNGVQADNNRCLDELDVNVLFCNTIINSERKLSLSNATTKSQFSLAPNPTNSTVAIVFDTTTVISTIEIYDLLGKKIASKQCNSPKGTWDFDSTAMAQGVYIVVFKNENEILSQQKLIKN